MIWRISVIMALWGILLGGCSPKRVTSTGVMIAEPAPEPKSEAVPTSKTSAKPTEILLPAPEPISKSGTDAVPSQTLKPTALGPRAVELAKDQLGKPYQWGAAGPDKFDCSGLVQYVYSNLGVPLPRVSGQQAGAGVHVDRKDLQPGDLVFFRLSGTRIDHVGIYVGRGKFVHAPSKESPVRFDSLNDTWWRGKFRGGRRVG